MEPLRPLASCLIGRGTVSAFRDMLRVLETIDDTEYRFVVHGELIDEGAASLVKLMADPDSATIVVNGCMFLNVASFRYLDFERGEDGRWCYTLYGDGSTLELIAVPDTEESEPSRPRLLAIEETQDFESLILLDDDEDDE
jgi:hypothetical protein